MQKMGLYEFMHEITGRWDAEDIETATKLYGEGLVAVGKIANDITFKKAMIAASNNDIDVTKETDETIQALYHGRFVFEDERSPIEQYPVILSEPSIAPERGLFEWAYDGFYTYWAHLPETEFIAFLPSRIGNIID